MFFLVHLVKVYKIWLWLILEWRVIKDEGSKIKTILYKNWSLGRGGPLAHYIYTCPWVKQCYEWINKKEWSYQIRTHKKIRTTMPDSWRRRGEPKAINNQGLHSPMSEILSKKSPHALLIKEKSSSNQHYRLMFKEWTRWVVRLWFVLIFCFLLLFKCWQYFSSGGLLV
jgi:hypothetical protein